MSDLKTVRQTARTTVQFCGRNALQIAGRTLAPDEDRSYVEFFLSHAFPVIIPSDRTGIHPQVVANSYLSMQDKVFNLGHLMKSYDPKQNPRDRILGTVVAVEFPETPEGGWKIGDKAEAPCIRAAAVMHKAAEQVEKILESWFEGKAPLGGVWTVSMENHHNVEDSGFLVMGATGVEKFAARTPEDLAALGWTYVPSQSAPLALLECLNNEADDIADKTISTRIKRDFEGQSVLFLLGGLDGSIRYNGVGLTPLGKEQEARVGRMLAGGEVLDLGEMFGELATAAEDFAKKIK